jgi:hypothetical protein
VVMDAVEPGLAIMSRSGKSAGAGGSLCIRTSDSFRGEGGAFQCPDLRVLAPEMWMQMRQESYIG